MKIGPQVRAAVLLASGLSLETACTKCAGKPTATGTVECAGGGTGGGVPSAGGIDGRPNCAE